MTQGHHISGLGLALDCFLVILAGEVGRWEGEAFLNLKTSASHSIIQAVAHASLEKRYFGNNWT